MSTAAPEVEQRRRRLPVPAGALRPLRLDVVILVLALAAGLAAPLLVRWFGLHAPGLRDPAAVDIFGNPTGPGAGHPLGVDADGRDVLARMLYGLRSLMLLALAGSALGVLAAWLAGRCAALHPWLTWLWGVMRSALWLFPVLLLALALSGRIGPGVWRMLVPIALGCLWIVPSWRALGAALATVLPWALGLDVGLSFLGVGPGGSAPQLGAMIAHAGTAIVAGVPEWWALLFPGLLVMVLLIAAGRLADAAGAALGPAPVPWRRSLPVGGAVADRLFTPALRVVVVIGFAALALPAIGSHNPGDASALAGVGAALAPSASLLGGGVVVWAVLSLVQIRTVTRASRFPGGGDGRRGLLGGLIALPAGLLAAAPVGWLAFLLIYAFSESVGKLPVLPGSGTYVGLTHNPGHWAQSLVIPWLLLGTAPAAALAPSLRRAARAVAGSGQQRVARGAGVPEAMLTHQRRRALAAPLLGLVAGALGTFLSLALVLEVAFKIPGVGLLSLSAFTDGHAATVSDVALLAALVLFLVGQALGALAVRADPGTVRA